MEFSTIVISGAVSGALYALLAVGLVLTYNTSRIFNFGHAATAFASAYLFYQLNGALGWNGWLAAGFIALVFAPLMGYTWNRLVFSRLTEAEESTKIVASVGVLIAVPAMTVLICDLIESVFHPGFQDIAEVFLAAGLLPTGSHTIAEGLVLTNDQLFALGASIVLFVALWAMLRYTRIGLQMRVTVDSPSLASLRGIRPRRVSDLSWVISFVLAAIAGILAVPFPGPFGLSNDNYTTALFVAITAAVIARLTSIPVAFAAGLAIGAARNLVVAYVNGEYLGRVGEWAASVYGLTSSLPFLILFIALIVMGQEKNRRKAGMTATAAAPLPDYRDDLSPLRKALPWVIKLAVVLVPGLFFANELWRELIAYGFALGLIFLSFTVLTGLGGMVSLAQGAFVTASALMTGMLYHHGVPMVFAFLVGVAFSCVLGVLTALPALRLSGLGIAFATLALALLAGNILFKIDFLSNGTTGWQIPRPALGPLSFENDRVFLVAVVLLAVGLAKVVDNLLRSATGRAMIAARTAEPAAAASGVSPASVKLTLFAVSSGIAGLGGIIAASVYGSINGGLFPPQLSFTWLAIIVVVGLRSPAAAIEAGMVAAVAPRVISDGFNFGFVSWGGTSNDLIAQAMFGLGAIQMASQPDGYLADVSRRARTRRDARRLRVAQPADRVNAEHPVAVSSTEMETKQVSSRVDDSGNIGRALLELQDVRSGYGGLEVLHGVSLAVEAGSVLGLLGANGSGKSTLCSTIAGLVPTTGGRILFDGEDITTLTTAERVARGVVLVPESRGVFPSISVEENLKVWLRDSRERAEAYELFPSLAQRRQQPAGNLSGGEQQMLSLAPFLVRRHRLLISDEPSLGLAQLVTRDIMAAFDTLRRNGTTVILVEEKARDVLDTADLVGALKRGELAWLKASVDVDADQITSAYLGTAQVV
ncbi:ATP-binding cassette domain-containing protein [Nocardioides marmoriginsengisoli]|uniref:ATP-binding cassette domain-containing protein n=1 Tax=Nocardioides marmoriginsengisoli TaxID=661483 RepID=A0A3N0CH99_9ACTN|nr:ATP-binding cassette domain-containing protein [Nocardioides marmoriginsengisoli]RNL62827.1 ATP-binding cassette domain-containing protein [Nocardioides marmoriginsengisoli]